MAQSFRTNLANVAIAYLRSVKISVTDTSLKKALEQNPYYPSLYSLSNVFDRFNIDNEAYSVEESNLDQFEPPFITYCSNQNTGSDFVLVTMITGSTVSYIAENNKEKQVSREEFLKNWQKIVFVAEGNEQSGDKDYQRKLKTENLEKNKQRLLYAGIAVLVGSMCYSFFNSSGNNIIAASALTIIKLLGTAITLLLLIYEIDKTNSFIKNICTAGKQSNCDAVLNSEASKILGMSWGEVGFFYFASTSLFLLLPGLNFVSKIPWLAISATLASPYIIFSIYYQWKVVKQWCPLCIAVQLVLAMELAWSILNFWTSRNLQLPVFNTVTLFTLAACLFIPLISWYLLKPVFLAAKTAPGYNAAYKRLLYNPEMFNNLLQQQTAAPDGWQNLGINIGNPNASNTIIKVCNPYCGPCAQAHPVLEEIVKHNNDINVKIIFTATNNANDRSNKPVKHLLAIAEKGNIQKTQQALDDWYMADKKEYETFAARYPMNGELKQQENKIDLMSKWCDGAEIAGTPTIFINGKLLPETYSISELKHLF